MFGRLVRLPEEASSRWLWSASKKDDEYFHYDYFIWCRRYLFLDLHFCILAIVYKVYQCIIVFVLVEYSVFGICVSFDRNVRSFAVSASIIYKGIKMAKPTYHAHLSKMPPFLPSFLFSFAKLSLPPTTSGSFTSLFHFRFSHFAVKLLTQF